MNLSLRTTLKQCGAFLLVAAATLLWTTCEVGLGESVDTMAPTVSVTSPAASAVCKGTVVISGSCADDKAVARVNLVVTNTTTGAKFNYSADIKKFTSWSKSINEFINGAGYPLPDGSYTADVTAIDIFGRTSGTSSTAFDIDNTPPFFCVTSPASLNIRDPRNYGRSVTISGEISDDHDIAKMDIRVFRTDATGSNTTEITSALAKTTFTDFETAGGTTVYIAKYFDKKPDRKNKDGTDNNDWYLYENYMAMYDSTALDEYGNAYIYVVPTLTDIAGNTSEVCYLSSNLKNLAAKLCGVEITVDSLQTAQLMKILNGTYNLGEFNDEQKAAVISLLNGTYKRKSGEPAYYSHNADKARLAASVNKNNEPTYDFNGYENPASKGFVGVNTGGTITITLAAGRDGWGILPSSLVVNLYESDNGGHKIPGKGIVFSSSKDYDPTGEATIEIKDATNSPINEIKTSITSQSYYVTLPSLKSGHQYLVEAEGCDENADIDKATKKNIPNLAPLNGNDYGFNVASTITPPTMTSRDPFYLKADYILSSSPYAHRIYIKDVSDEIQTNGVNVTAYIYKGHVTQQNIGTYSGTPVKKAAKGSDAFKYTTEIKAVLNNVGEAIANEYYLDLPITDFGINASDIAGEPNYTIQFVAVAYYKDADGNVTDTSASTFLLWADKTAPAITFESPKDTDTLVTDDFDIHKKEGDAHYLAPSGKWGDPDGAGSYRMWWTDTDKTGVPTMEWPATVAGEEYKKGTCYYERLPSEDGAASYCYVLLDTDTFKDGDSVEGYYKHVLSESYSANWEEITNLDQAADMTEWSKKIPVTEGKDKFFRLFAVDAVGNCTAAPVERTGMKYDFAIPTIVLKSEPASGGYYNLEKLTANNKIEILAKDSYEIAAAGVSVKASKNGVEITSATAAANGYSCAVAQSQKDDGQGGSEDDPTSVTVTITLANDGKSDGKWKFVVNAEDSAKDSAGKGRAAKEYVLERTVDTVAPDFSSVDWTDDAWYVSTVGLVFSGKIDEATSGLAKVAYDLTPTPESGKDATSGEQLYNGETTGADAISFKITPDGFAESVRGDDGRLSTNSLKITAKDKAGNSKEISLPTVNIDPSQPSFKAAYYAYDNLVKIEGPSTIMSDGKKDMTVYGTVSSPLSGVKSLKLLPDALVATVEYTTDPLTAAASSYTGATWKPLDGWYEWEDEGHTKKRPTPYKITGWKAVIAGGNITAGAVKAVAENKAGTSAESQIFSLKLDKDSPTIVLSDPDTCIKAYKGVKNGGPAEKPTTKPDGRTIPTEAASVNGTNNISGSASDTNQLSSVIVYESTDATATIDTSDTSPDKPKSYSGSMSSWTVTGYEFSKAVDSNAGLKYQFADGAYYEGTAVPRYIKVQAKDVALNETIAVYEYSVDPGSDRPKIALTSFDSVSMSECNDKINDATIKGTIEDDDGVAGLKLYYNDNGEVKQTGKTYGDYDIFDPADSEGKQKVWRWLELEDNGKKASFSLFADDTDHDGEHTILFKVIDAAGTVFVSGAGSPSGTGHKSEGWVRPMIYKGSKAGGGYWGDGADGNQDDTTVRVRIDTKAPTVGIPTFKFDGDTTETTDIGLVGGTKNKFNMYFTAKDSSDLDLTKTKFELNGVAYENPKKADDAGPSDNFIYTETDGTYTFTVKVDVKNFDTETDSLSQKNYIGTITVTDKVGMTNDKQRPQITVDNTKPVIMSYEPSQTQTVFGTVNANGKVTGGKKGNLWFALSDSAIDIESLDDDDYKTFSETFVNPIEQSDNSSWELYFDSTDSTKDYEVIDGKTHPLAIKQFILKYHVAGIDGETAYDNYKQIIPLYLYIKSVDEVGNEKIECFNIKFDPQGTRPTVTFTYPEDNEQKIGGEQKFNGETRAKGNASIAAVYVQIGFVASASTATTFTPKAADWNAIKDKYTIVKMSDGTTAWPAGGTDADAPLYGIKTSVSGIAWAIKLNDQNNLYKADTKVGIKVYAYDTAGNVSEPETRFFMVDNDKPVMTGVYLKQFDSNKKEIANKEYKEGMYVKGDWYLTFVVSDGNTATSTDIKDLTITWTEPSKPAKRVIVDGVVMDTDICSPAGGGKTVSVTYPLPTNTGVGTLEFSVEFEDSSDRDVPATVEKKFKINYDNKAPVLLNKGESGYNISEDVHQANGWYSMDSKVTEADVDGTKQSGFERLAFYFTRGSGDAMEIFDPMISKKADGYNGNRRKIKDATLGNLKSEDGLYWKEVTVTRSSDNLGALTLPSSSDANAYANIHVGGLAKLGGSVYLIKAVSGSSVTIDGQPAYSEATETALFAIANVVDNLTVEKGSDDRQSAAGYGYGYNANHQNDDGDRMVEAVTKEKGGQSWSWNANIYSKNIPDGSVEIHYVAFDKAGNWAQAGGKNSEGITPAGNPPLVHGTVSNNRPRIANLYVGTDLNADNKVGDPAHPDEYESATGEWAAPLTEMSYTWNQDKNSGTAVTSATLGKADEAYLTAKGKTVIRPEILGGNGDISYSYKISGKDGEEDFTIDGPNKIVFISDAQAVVNPLADEEARSGAIIIQVGDFTSEALRLTEEGKKGIPNCAASAPHKFEFTFYDETEDAPAKADATIYMASEVNDNIVPTSESEEFFWNGKGETDEDGKPLNSVVWKGSTPRGHIELKEDLKKATYKNSSGVETAVFTETGVEKTIKGTKYPANLLDLDEKVSGKIVLRGHVHDNTILRRIYLNIPKMKKADGTDWFAGIMSKAAAAEPGNGKGYIAAEYDISADTWTTPAATDDTLKDYGIKFTITPEPIGPSGHDVDWEFVWDTSFVKGVAATDVTVDVYATDQLLSSLPDDSGSLIGLNGTTKYATPVNYERNVSDPAARQVDVVPYITGLVTYLSGKGAAYARTALGHWPVWLRTDSPEDENDKGYATSGDRYTKKEAFEVQGFNFDHGTGDTDDKISVTQLESGPYVKSVNSVFSLNNVNYNDAALDEDNDYENAYNRQPNGKNNDLLTDDVYIDVWQLNGAAARPSALRIEMPSMKINPDNGMIGFAFRHGSRKKDFSMPNGINSSYTLWHTANDQQNSVALGYNDNGQAFGTVAGGESGNSGGYYTDFYSIYSSIWGVASGGDADDSHRNKIEITGQIGDKQGNGATQTNLKTKHQSPSIAAAGTNVYLAYYDSWNKEIRFRSSLGNDMSTRAKVGNFYDEYKHRKNQWGGNDHAAVVAYSKANCQIVADDDSTVAKPGQYVSIAAMPGVGTKDNNKDNDAVVMVWYDGNNMWYSYNNTPTTKNRKNSVNSQTDAATDGWSVPVNIKDFGNKVGAFCKAAFDGKGGVHIAAFDESNGDVCYAYLASYASPGSADSCVVDADGTVGQNLTLDVAIDSNGKAIPYIGYYADNRAKMARPAKAVKAGEVKAGADSNGKFTQDWEVAYVPTTNTVQQDNINVGVWKTKMVKAKTGGVWENSTKNNEAVYSDASSGVCYGNGTKNAVLGYRYEDANDITAGYIETAQLTGKPYDEY